VPALRYGLTEQSKVVIEVSREEGLKRGEATKTTRRAEKAQNEVQYVAKSELARGNAFKYSRSLLVQVSSSAKKGG